MSLSLIPVYGCLASSFLSHLQGWMEGVRVGAGEVGGRVRRIPADRQKVEDAVKVIPGGDRHWSCLTRGTRRKTDISGGLLMSSFVAVSNGDTVVLLAVLSPEIQEGCGFDFHIWCVFFMPSLVGFRLLSKGRTFSRSSPTWVKVCREGGWMDGWKDEWRTNAFEPQFSFLYSTLKIFGNLETSQPSNWEKCDLFMQIIESYYHHNVIAVVTS